MFIRKKRRPKTHEKIRYKAKDEEQWIYAKVIGRGRKATGKNKDYINVMNEKDEKTVGIYLDRCQYEIIHESEENEFENSQKVTEQTNIEEINVTYVPLGEHWRPEVIEAKEKELDNWNKFNVFQEVQDIGQKTISTRWVITQKEQEKP